MIHLRPPSCLRYERGRDERRWSRKSPKGEERARRRAVHGWCMYDWANSAFATSIGTAILPVYFVVLFKDAFGQSTTFLGFTFTGSSMWSLGVAVVGGHSGAEQPDPGDDRRQVADQADDAAGLHDRRRDLHGAGVLQRLHRRAVGVGPRLLCDREHRVRGRHRLLQLDAATPGGTGRAGQDQQPRVRVRVRGRRAAAGGPPCGYPGVLRHRPRGLGHEACGRVSGSMVAGLGAVDLQDGARAEGRQAGRPARPDDGGVRGIFPGAPDVKGAQALADARTVPRVRTCYSTTASRPYSTIAGAFGPDTLGISLVSNMGTVLIVQFVAAGGAVMFGRAAGALGTKAALTIALGGWCFVIAVAVGFAPLVPEAHEDFDFRLEHTGAGEYEVAAGPDLSDEGDDSAWGNLYDHLLAEESLSRSQVLALVEAVRTSDLSRFGISVKGGELDGMTGIGPAHPSLLVDESPLGFWPAHAEGPRVEAAGHRGGHSVAHDGRAGGPGAGREPGAGEEPVRVHDAGEPERGVLRILRVRGARVGGVRPDAVPAGDGDLRHAGSDTGDPDHHRGRDGRYCSE